MNEKDPNVRRDRKDPNPDPESDRDFDPTDRENVERPTQQDRDTDEPVPAGDTDDEM